MKTFLVSVLSVLGLLSFVLPAPSNASTNASIMQVCDSLGRIQAGMSVAASNLANVKTTRTIAGGPYLVRDLVCEADTCEIQQSAKTIRIYEPSHVDADSDGYVLYPDIDVQDELAQIEMLVAIYEKASAACRSTY